MGETVELNFLGLSIGFNVLIAMIATVLIVLGLCIYMTRNLSVDNPGKPQLILEWLIDFTRGILQDSFGNTIPPAYLVIALTLLMTIFVSNLLGLPFLVEANGISYWKSPTADLAVALTLSVLMNLISHFLGIRAYGLGQYFKVTYMTPNILKLPISLVEELINTLTLALRLFGNIFAGEVLLALIATAGNSFGVVTWLFGIPLEMVWQGFSLFIGAIQAYIFVTLSMVYLSEKVPEGQH